MIETEDGELNEKLFDDIAKAFDGVPILEQLRVAHNIICDKGGERANSPQDPLLITAAEAVRRVMTVLEEHPEAAKLTKA